MEIPRYEADVDTVAHVLNDVDAGLYGKVVTPRLERDVLAELGNDADRHYARMLAHAANERRRNPHGDEAQRLMEAARHADAARPADGDSTAVTIAAVALAVGYAASVRRQKIADTAADQRLMNGRDAERENARQAPRPEKGKESERTPDKSRSGAAQDFRRAFQMAATAVGPIATDEVEPNMSPVDPVQVAESVAEMSKSVSGLSKDVLDGLKAAAKCAGRGTASQRRKVSAAARRPDGAREDDRSHDYDLDRDEQGLTL